MFPSVLIVDDEPSILQSLGGLLSDEGFEVITASNGYAALKSIETESPDLVLLDIWMPGIDGIETLKEIKKTNPHIQVIIITGHGTIETAVKAVKLGAFDLIEKPLSIDKILVTISNALNFRRLEEENKYLRKKMLEKHSITGTSQATMELRQQIVNVARSDLWVLISGENGTGKELVARTIHQLSRRADQPLIEINCAAIPEKFMDMELFGQERIDSTGVTTKQVGKFELANHGTLFFDEIGDMNLKTQAKILRVLQEKQFQRIGGTRPIRIDLRVIASTNKDLEAQIQNRYFRKDLFYRLNVVPIRVPPLRDRIDDLPDLADFFLDEYAKQNRTQKKVLSRAAEKQLMIYPWPGNVRELKNLMERITIMIPKPSVELVDLPPPYRSTDSVRLDSAASEIFFPNDFKKANQAFEKEFIKRKLLEFNQNVEKTARMTGLDKSYILKRMN
jgi:two-component system nitrogen regulation response regulator NtrX